MMKKIILIILLVSFYMGNMSLAQHVKPIIKDDPIGRANYEYNLLKNSITNKIPENIRQKELAFANILLKNTKGLEVDNWSHRGPFNVGGRTRALGIDVNNESIILAGGVSGGMWRSTDGGQSWVKTTGSSDLQSVSSIAQDTRAGQTLTWYYTTGELRGNSASASGAPYRGDGVYKSIDNGLTWSKLAATGDDIPQTFDRFFNYSWNVKVNPVNGDVYVASYGKIYRSQDGGTSWNAVLSGGTSSYADYSDIAISSTGVCYATFSDNDENVGIFRSVDGTNWVNITPTSFPTLPNRIVLDIAKSDETVVYFLANTPSAGQNDHSLWKYMYVSGDGAGANGTWVDRSANLPAAGGYTGDFGSQGSYDLFVKVKPDDENFVIIGGVNLYRSTDAFTTTTNTSWIGGYVATNDSYAKYANHHPDQHSLVFMPSDSKIVIMGNDGGLNKTLDITSTLSVEEPVSWSVLNYGYRTTQSYAIAIDNENYYDNKILTGLQDNGSWLTKEISGEVNWSEEGSGDGTYCAFGRKGFIRYTSSQNGRVYGDFYKTSGAYEYWTRVDPGTGGQFVNPYILDPNNNSVMYFLGGNKIYRNTNLEEIPSYSQSPATTNWSALNNSVVSGSITALSVSKDPANMLYYGTSDGKFYKLTNALVGDPTPEEITGINFPSGNIGSVLVDPTDINELFVTFTNYEVVSIWHSSDAGANWESISGNLEENIDGTGNGPSVRWISMLRMAGDNPIYFVGTSTGLYSTSTLNGNSTAWTQEGASVIGNVVVTMIKTRMDGLVVVGTHGNGMYSANYTSSTVSPPVLISAQTSDAETATTKIDLAFDKEMISPAGSHMFFSVVVDGDNNNVISSLYKAGDPNSYTLTVENNIAVGNNIIVSYVPGDIKSADGGILQEFLDQGVSNTVNVEEIKSERIVKIYPNPNNGVFNLEILNEKTSNFILAIYNMHGQIVYFSKQDNVSHLNRVINLQKQAKGMYNLEIVEDGKASHYKVLIE